MNFDEYLQAHGITQETANKFGWVDTGGFKIAIPIKDEQGQLLYHKYRHLNGDTKFSFDPGSSSALYNSQALAHPKEYIVICEGEPDCLRLAQEGLTAVCGTVGAGSFKEEWAQRIQAANKQIIIIYDNDPAGAEGTQKLQTLLPSAWVVKLPDGFKDICDYLLHNSFTDFLGLLNQVKTENSVTFEQLCGVVDKWLLLPDKNVLKILAATLVAHRFSTDPLWLLLIAPPSGTKTELISATSSLSFVYFLSDLTPQTLASGLKYKDDPSLLAKLKNEVIIMKDFTTVLSMRQEERQIILSQLREVYDGKYSKAFGTGKKVEWEGRLGFIAGVTTIVDTHLSLFQVMGERFIQYRIPQPNDEEVGRMALSKFGQEKQMRSEMRDAFKKYFAQIKIPKVEEIIIPEEIITALVATASLTVLARSGIIRDNYKKEITYIPEPEAPSRLTKQLGTLVKALCVVRGGTEVSWADYYLTLRVALDIIPRNRMVHLKALCNQYKLTTSAVALATDYSVSGAEMILEDLAALKLVTVNRQGAGRPNEWELSYKLKQYMNKMLPSTDSQALKQLEETINPDDFYTPVLDQMKSLKAELVLAL